MDRTSIRGLLSIIALGIAVTAASEDPSTRYVEGDGFRGVILADEQTPRAGYLSREAVVGFWTPSEADIDALESRLRKALEAARTNPEQLDPDSAADPARRAYVSGEIGKILDHLPEYRRQYLGIRLAESKRVWVYFFPGEPKDRSDPYDYWLDRLVMVLDGGFWYWSIQFDPSTGNFVEFYSNGYA